MALFSEGQRVKIDRGAKDPPSPTVLFDRTGYIFKVIDLFDGTRKEGAPTEYMVWLDGDSQPKHAPESWLIAI